MKAEGYAVAFLCLLLGFVLGIGFATLVVEKAYEPYDASQGAWSEPRLIGDDLEHAPFVSYEDRLEERVSALEVNVAKLILKLTLESIEYEIRDGKLWYRLSNEEWQECEEFDYWPTMLLESWD